MNYTADEVMREISFAENGQSPLHGLAMLRELARRLRQDEARGPAWAGVNDNLQYEEVHEHAGKFAREGDSKTARMLHTLASRIRQDEEEAKRDLVREPVCDLCLKDSREGEFCASIQPPEDGVKGRYLCSRPAGHDGEHVACVGAAGHDFARWDNSATIIPRREGGG